MTQHFLPELFDDSGYASADNALTRQKWYWLCRQIFRCLFWVQMYTFTRSEYNHTVI